MPVKSLPRGITNSRGKIRIFIQYRGMVYKKTHDLSATNSQDIATAVKRREEILFKMKVGLPITDESDIPDPRLMQFRKAAIEYLKIVDANYGLKRSSFSDYQRDLQFQWIPRFGNIPCSHINARMINNALASMDVSIKTKKNRVIPLRGVLDHIGVNSNPCNLVKLRLSKKARIKTKNIDRYTLTERANLLSLLEDQAKVYFSILFGCGLRPGEALALKWEDYQDWQLSISKQITRRRFEGTTKTGVNRQVKVPKWTREILESYRTSDCAAENWIFLNALGNHFRTTDYFLEKWRSAHNHAGIAYRHPYICRHTRAAELLSTGEHYAAAAKQLGHSTEMFFRTYSEWIEGYSGENILERFEGRDLVVNNLHKQADSVSFKKSKTATKPPQNVINFENYRKNK
ncbi:MAG: hypothetical protein CMP91_06620 [Gammaproteobacteria bacterium]|nr:hypothetical protein [Gammaproteobacteria bacterium]|tara:strand:- start:124466 stop:125674 length:1209 start_codon:yes stop_codon:yes gene_type:complete